MEPVEVNADQLDQGTAEDLPGEPAEDLETGEDMETGEPAEDPARPVEAAPAPAIPADRESIIAHLIARGTRRDRAVLYADTFLEYRAAQANVIEFGTIVANPRTGQPIENPMIKIRDRAFKRLMLIKGTKGHAELW